MSFQKALAGILAGAIALVGIIFGLPTGWATPDVQAMIVGAVSSLAAVLWKDGKTVIFATASEAQKFVDDPRNTAVHAALVQ